MLGRSKQRLYHTLPPSQNVSVRPPDPAIPNLPQGLQTLPHTIGTEHLTHSALHSTPTIAPRTRHRMACAAGMRSDRTTIKP